MRGYPSFEMCYKHLRKSCHVDRKENKGKTSIGNAWEKKEARKKASSEKKSGEIVVRAFVRNLVQA